MGKCPACEAGGLRESGGIPRAGSGPAEPADRRCGSWLLSSSRTSRSSWSAESLSATTHYFQWAVSCGGGGRAWGQHRAPVPGNCSIPALLPGTAEGRGARSDGGRRGEKKEKGRQREGGRERCPRKRSAVPGATVLKKCQRGLQGQGYRKGHTATGAAEPQHLSCPCSSHLK